MLLRPGSKAPNRVTVRTLRVNTRNSVTSAQIACNTIVVLQHMKLENVPRNAYARYTLAV